MPIISPDQVLPPPQETHTLYYRVNTFPCVYGNISFTVTGIAFIVGAQIVSTIDFGQLLGAWHPFWVGMPVAPHPIIVLHGVTGKSTFLYALTGNTGGVQRIEVDVICETPAIDYFHYDPYVRAMLTGLNFQQNNAQFNQVFDADWRPQAWRVEAAVAAVGGQGNHSGGIGAFGMLILIVLALYFWSIIDSNMKQYGSPVAPTAIPIGP